ncbi:hypothetical protein ALO59_102061 [Pseudomonas amygdali pv. mellea]|nr:hypothetical protein ALO51_102109 [Pseudomonas amygdali]KPX83978.1 hypothetical protein ALO59_102061 [Pseudomonas amygdali pv. mellea]
MLLSQQQCVILVQCVPGSPEPGAMLWLVTMVRPGLFHFHVPEAGNCRAAFQCMNSWLAVV